jgi:hypothetical protein
MEKLQEDIICCQCTVCGEKIGHHEDHKCNEYLIRKEPDKQEPFLTEEQAHLLLNDLPGIYSKSLIERIKQDWKEHGQIKKSALEEARDGAIIIRSLNHEASSRDVYNVFDLYELAIAEKDKEIERLKK